MSAGPAKRTAKDYLALERRGDAKHELLDGKILPISAASWAHGRIRWNLSGVLHAQLENHERVGFVGDMRVHVPATDRYTYPDVIVACGEPQFEDAELDTLLNPTLIVEILSSSTGDQDRGGKLLHYRDIPSLQIILLVAEDRIHVEQLERQAGGSWRSTQTDDPDAVLDLPCITARLALADVYDRVPGL